MRIGRFIAAVVVLVGLGMPYAAHASEWPETKDYLAAATLHTESFGAVFLPDGFVAVGLDEAAGPVRCGDAMTPGIGGVCFDTSGHAGKTFSITVSDSQCGNSCPVFAGFDDDADGQVCTKNNSALGTETDHCWEGDGTVVGQVPLELRDHTLYVFVRVATIDGFAFAGAGIPVANVTPIIAGPMGHVTINGCEGCGLSSSHFGNVEVCQKGRDPQGECTHGDLPYPYPH